MSVFVQNDMAKAFGLWYPSDEEVYEEEYFDEMDKAIDKTKCHIEWITDKNGHKKRVWVRNDPKSKGKHHAFKQQEENTENKEKKEEESAPKQYKAGDINKGDTVTFTDPSGSTVTGFVKAVGQDGVTVETPNKVEQAVRYDKITKGGFDAQNYKMQYTDKLVTASYKTGEKDEKGKDIWNRDGENRIWDIMAEKYPSFGKEAAEKAQNALDEMNKRIEKEGDTEKRFSDGNGHYSIMRQKLHEHIIRSFFYGKVKSCKPENPPPKFVMFGGRGGSGKSWFTDKERAASENREVMFDEDKFLIIDADAIKSYLPEYNGANAGEVHEESSYLAKKIRAKALEMGLNVIIDGTMNYNEKKPNKTRDEFLEAKKMGYSTEAHYMFLPVQESSTRVVTRWADVDKQTGEPHYDGRLVPMEISVGMQDNEKAFDSIKDLVDDWSFRDNNRPKGEGPLLVSQKKK